MPITRLLSFTPQLTLNQLAWAFLWLSTLLGMMAYSTAQAAGPVLHVLVSYGPAADGYQQAFTGRFTQPQSGQTGEGYTGKTLGTISASVITILGPVTADTARPASDLIADLKTEIANNINQIAASMATQIHSQNASSGVMEHKQDVRLPNDQTGVLTWRLMVDSSGAVRYGDPEVLPADALTLDVVYTPLNLSALLPATWPRYTDAGLLKWRLIDKTGTARTGWVSVDAAGAFDDPESTANENVDPDSGLKCLILDRTRCGGPTDIKTLMAQQGAIGAYVTYTRKITPVYDNVADPANAGQFIQRPRISLSVSNRELSYNGCGQALTYRNQGAYGYTLAMHAERYLVQATGDYQPVDWSDQTQISPTETYDKSVSVSRTDSVSVAAQIINPGPAGSDLVNAADVPGLTYLAPVVQSGDMSDIGIAAVIRSVVDARDIYKFTYSCTADYSSGVIPVTIQVSNTIVPGMLENRCGGFTFGSAYTVFGSTFTVNIAPTIVDSAYGLVANMNVGLDVYDNGCAVHHISMQRNGCVNNACHVDFMIEEGTSQSGICSDFDIGCNPIPYAAPKAYGSALFYLN